MLGVRVWFAFNFFRQRCRFQVWCIIVLFVTCDARSIKERDIREESEKVPFELDDFLNGTFGMRSWNGTWITDTAFIYMGSDRDVLKFDVETRTSEVFLEKDVLANYAGATISLSADQSKVLIRYNVSSVFRHSTTALFTIYDMSTNNYYDIANLSPVQLVTFAPSGHGLVYVLDNNIYYLQNFAVDVNNPVPVTNIGEVGVVYCGVPDWVYEEEVLASGSALWFSPNATYIAYAVFRDENVTDFSYYVYGEPGSLESQYPSIATIKYPKVGTPNPIVTVYVYDISTKATIEFQLPGSIDNKGTNNYILYGLTWISDTEVAMISTNRVQNESVIIRCTTEEGMCYVEQYYKEEKGWLDPFIPRYSKDGKKRLEILPQPVDDDQYDHLVLTDVETYAATRLTYGRSVVGVIYGWDEESGLIYYSASVNDTPSQNQIYVVSTEGERQCLTCDMVVDGEKCLYAAAAFSKSLSYYIKVCRGPKPTYTVIESTKNANDAFVWEDNPSVQERLALKKLPVIRNLTVPINEKFTARVKLFLPPDLDETSTTKYPAIVYAYGGPNNNLIADSFSVGFQYYLVTNRKYVYIFIDARGSGRDGRNRMFEMYRKFGTVEVQDQITVTKYLQENLPYIDANRTGIWGWSYGGFLSTWALVQDTDHVFNFALAVAPVTSFIYYDTIYTERYMGLPTPEDNEIGYNNTDTTRRVEAIRGRRYFIIHGNADDNVHYQNAMVLVKALEQADIEFRQLSYPDENHALGSVSRHLYHTLDNYWARCFDVEGPPITVWSNKEIDS